MSQIATYRGPRLPTISRALGDAIAHQAEVVFGAMETPAEREAREKRGEPCPSMVIRVGHRDVSGAVVAEARRILPDLERAMEPCPTDMIRAYAEQFVEMIAASVAIMPDEKTISLRCAALAMACGDLPSMAFSPEALKACITRFKFFPSVHEIMEVLSEHMAPMRDKIARTRMISRTTPREAPPARRMPTEEERAAVSASVERLRGERARRDAEEAAVREYGSWMPEGAENLSGEDLAGFLEGVLPDLEGKKREVTEKRIEMLREAARLARMIVSTNRVQA